MKSVHSFHIPVMGTGFTIDTPLKVAKYGISSVISLVDDDLIEDMRAYYSHLMKEDYVPISRDDEDHRARRITAYLNLVDKLVKKQFEEVKNASFEPGSEISKYFEMLPDNSSLKKNYQEMLQELNADRKKSLQEQLRSQMKLGDINVNIMTKLDKNNYSKDGTMLAEEYSDALSALRGYALSTLNSAIVFSAGFNRRLYGYAEKFKDFYADATGFIKKRIVLKVSDFRSSLIQGRFLAKKGLWVSEYRVESGLNCGGHAFATDGFLMGPILEEFHKKRDELINSLHNIYNEALKVMNRPTFPKPHEILVTAQGGIGTATENKFLIEHYQLDSTGWGTPFLLVPEAVNVDPDTLGKLSAAKEDDVFLSEVSPLGVPFHNLKMSSSELEKQRKIEAGRPGSSCPKGFLVSNTEFTQQPICTASRQYQKLKIDQLNAANVPLNGHLHDVIKKSCICNDLAESPLIIHKIEKRGVKRFTAVCPGPNIAYFSKIVTLAEMVGHIYGRINIMDASDRPHMFIKELKLYVDYFIKEIQKAAPKPTDKQMAYLNEFKKNLFDGIEYYKELFPKMIYETQSCRNKALEELQMFKNKLEDLIEKNAAFFMPGLQKLVPAVP